MDSIGRLKAAYRALPPGRRAPPRVEAFAARAANRLFGRASTAPARALEAKLLAGFAVAEADLAAMAADPRVHRRRAAAAAWALARWHAGQGAPEAALAALGAVRARDPGGYPESRLVEADCLIRLSRTAEAAALLAPRGVPPGPEAALLLAGFGDTAARRAAIAAAFGPVGGLPATDPDLPFGIDTLDGPADAFDPAPGTDAGPFVSVIVPVHLQWDLAARLLAYLAAQTLQGDRFEAIFVNNGGPLPDPEPEPPPGAGFAFRRLDCPEPGAYAARNFGAAAARGDLLVFTDADCAPVPGWLAAFAASAASAPGLLLAGLVRMVPGPDGAADTPFAAYDRLRGIPQERYVRLGYAATANLAVPRAVFAALGGFDAARFSGGDAAFCRAAGRAGARIALAPGAEVAHPVRASWEALATKARRVKGGQIRGGPPRARAVWLLRTLTPPLRATARFLRAPAPWAERRVAIRVLFRLWGIELAETARLIAGGRPERR